MLSACRPPIRTIGRDKARARTAPKGLQQKQQPQQRQALLGVARRCRDCGAQLDALNSTLHRCSSALEWTLGGESLPTPQVGGASEGGACRGLRFLRLGRARLLSQVAQERLNELWEFVRNDLSHGLDLPAPERLLIGAADPAAIFLALRGKEAVGLLVAERVVNAELFETKPLADADEAMRLAEPAKTGTNEEVLGINLVWVRRTERRKGLATLLLDVARQQAKEALATQLPSTLLPPSTQSPAMLPLARVAFSQPTSDGFRLAARYAGPARDGKVLVYQPR
eukprot:TRINITY_DN73274_c0_g1_i1.p1 TRINITY_DN73274_c0_g1~~TRINITY_DN73274_c0_g1_i1.p1  ORF type:complete len:283 (-),score=51.95 TRINITY_DN73274_c0_g1_i1:37-885(-)